MVLGTKELIHGLGWRIGGSCSSVYCFCTYVLYFPTFDDSSMYKSNCFIFGPMLWIISQIQVYTKQFYKISKCKVVIKISTYCHLYLHNGNIGCGISHLWVQHFWLKKKEFWSKLFIMWKWSNYRTWKVIKKFPFHIYRLKST